MPARRYVSQEDAEQVAGSNAVNGELLLRLHPDKVTSLTDSDDWGPELSNREHGHRLAAVAAPAKAGIAARRAH